MSSKNKNLDIRCLIDIDPSFNPRKFENYSKDIFLKLQDAWTNDIDIDSWNDDIRQYMTDNLFNFYKKQLNRLKKANQRNVIKRISCNSKILCYKEIENYDFIAVKLTGKLIDYIEGIHSKSIYMGKKHEKIDFTYTYIFIRPIIARDPYNLQSLNCAYCGATIDPGTSNRCPYCQGINVTTNSPEWILCRVELGTPYHLLDVIPYEEDSKVVAEINNIEERGDEDE